jgi:hypothetical protein
LVFPALHFEVILPDWISGVVVEHAVPGQAGQVCLNLREHG